MLDVLDFITDRGGDPKKVKESQRKRYADEAVVDEVIALYEDARASGFLILCGGPSLIGHAARYQVSQIKTQINGVQ